jgi:hypothetical protein
MLGIGTLPGCGDDRKALLYGTFSRDQPGPASEILNITA